MKRAMLMLAAGMCLALAGTCMAQAEITDIPIDAPPAENSPVPHNEAPPKIELAYDHPELPGAHATWAGATVMVILGMFLAAAGVGVVVRTFAPEGQAPQAHGHDAHGPGDAHGAAHHH